MALSDTLFDLSEDLNRHLFRIDEYLDPHYPIDYAEVRLPAETLRRVLREAKGGVDLLRFALDAPISASELDLIEPLEQHP